MARYSFKPCLLFGLIIFVFLHVTAFFWRAMTKVKSENPVIQCTVPVLNPFDAAVMAHTKQIIIKCKKPIIHLIKHDLEYLKVTDEPFLSMNQLNCCYTPYLQQGLETRRKFGNSCVSIIKKTKVKHEFVRVECNDDQHTVYTDYVDFVLPNNKFPPVKKQSNHLNVLILLLDGVSRMAVYRHLPKTKKYLEKLDAIEFTKFMRVGENTFPNVMAMLTGYEQSKYYQCWRSHTTDTFDSCPFVWKSFSQAKYQTAFAEDGGHIDTFNHEKPGFFLQPVDYYWRPFNLLLDDIKTDAQNAETPYTRVCAGDTPIHTLFFNYTRKFVKRMMKDHQKFFGFFHSNSASHDDNGLLASIDDELKHLFMEFKASGVLKQTIIFFLSDHGARYGEIRKTYQGYFEVNLPFLFVYLPERFKNERVSLYDILKSNKDQLTTMYDIHSTLRVIASNFTIDGSSDLGISLFRQIPSERTCSDVGVPLEFCVCAQNYLMVTDHALKFVAGQALVNHINEMLDSFTDCATLSLSTVLDARRMEFRSELGYVYQLKVIVRTQPGTGVFEGILRRIERRYMVMGTVSRVSMYGNESFCMKNTLMKLYCYCH